SQPWRWGSWRCPGRLSWRGSTNPCRNGASRGPDMTTTQVAILWTYAAIVAIWPIRHAVLWFLFRRLDVLSARSPRFAAPDPPLVSVIIPARDEEGTLAECLASVCAQTYPNLEILVVDDRSTDLTSAIARGFAAADPRLRVISVATLPPGWTGKTHALH